MELTWGALILLCLAGAIGWFWQDSLVARERANAAALEACGRLALEFLDGTVAFARLAIVRGAAGRLTLRRTYVFDYTANSIERRQGFVVLSGHQIESIGYAQNEAAGSRRVPLRAPEPVPPAPRDGSVVLNIEDFRSRARDAATPPDRDTHS